MYSLCRKYPGTFIYMFTIILKISLGTAPMNFHHSCLLITHLEDDWWLITAIITDMRFSFLGFILFFYVFLWECLSLFYRGEGWSKNPFYPDLDDIIVHRLNVLTFTNRSWTSHSCQPWLEGSTFVMDQLDREFDSRPGGFNGRLTLSWDGWQDRERLSSYSFGTRCSQLLKPFCQKKSSPANQYFF